MRSACVRSASVPTPVNTPAIDRQMDRYTDRYIDRCIDGCIDRQIDTQIDKLIERQIDTDRQTNRQIYRQIYRQLGHDFFGIEKNVTETTKNMYVTCILFDLKINKLIHMYDYAKVLLLDRSYCFPISGSCLCVSIDIRDSSQFTFLI